MAAAPAAAAAAAAAAPVLPPTSFLMALQRNVNVSSACVAGVTALLEDATRAKQADFFSGKAQDALGLLLPVVIKDYVLAKDKRQGIADLIYTPPLFALGVPDSCGYLPGMHYCQVDVIDVFTKWGVCVPRECGVQDVFAALFPPVVQKLAARAKGVCGSLNHGATLFIAEPSPLSPAAVSTLVFLALLLLAALAATVADVYGKRRQASPTNTHDGSRSSSSTSSSILAVAGGLVDCFSLRQNYERLMAPPRPGPFRCLEAVRVLAMCQVILGHTLWFLIHVSGIGNPREALGFYNRGFLSTGTGLIANSSLFGVDAFFAMAGFFAVLLFLQELHKRFPRTEGAGQRAVLFGQMAIISLVRRYLRLTPAFAVVLAVFTTLAPYLESAPPSPTGLGHEVALCRAKWWQNLLYVQNFLSSSYDQCYVPAWWLAVIMQLSLLVPAIALAGFWRPRAGVALCLLGCLASYAYSIVTGQREHWRLNAMDRPGFPLYFEHYYVMPFTRLPTFVLGCLAAVLWHGHGEAFTRFMHRGRRRGALKAWGLVAAALVVLGLVEWGPHRELAYSPGKWTQAESSLYIALSNSAWALGLGLVCAVLFAGQGGPLKTLLELPCWTVAARLTFSTYLVHPMVIWVALGSRGGQPWHFSIVSLVNEFVGFAGLSLVTAIVFYFVVEGPFTQVERWVFKGNPAAVAAAAAREGKQLQLGEDENGGSSSKLAAENGDDKEELVVAMSVSDVSSSEEEDAPTVTVTSAPQ